jgi:hypothetical protein
MVYPSPYCTPQIQQGFDAMLEAGNISFCIGCSEHLPLLPSRAHLFLYQVYKIKILRVRVYVSRLAITRRYTLFIILYCIKPHTIRSAKSLTIDQRTLWIYRRIPLFPSHILLHILTEKLCYEERTTTLSFLKLGYQPYISRPSCPKYTTWQHVCNETCS